MAEKISISEQLFQLLFEQNSKDSADIKELTNAMNTLTQLIAKLPLTSDIANNFKDFEIKNEKLLINSTKSIIENVNVNKTVFSDIFIKLDKIYDTVTSKLSCLQNKIKTMITVVLVAFSLLTIAYFFVSNSIDNKIDNKIIQVEIE